MKPENVSIITGEKAKRAEAKIPERIFFEALNPSKSNNKSRYCEKKDIDPPDCCEEIPIYWG